MPFDVSYVVEGDLDDVVIRRLLSDNNLSYQGIGQRTLNGADLSRRGQIVTIKVGGKWETIIHRSGKTLVNEVAKLVNPLCSSKRWVAIRDLDEDFKCPGRARKRWLPNPAPYMCFRIAVRSVEAWLLADAEMIAAYLKVNVSEVPTNSEELPDPKVEMLLLAEKSRDEEIVSAMVKRSGDKVSEGDEYTDKLRLFVKRSNWWRPAEAKKNSRSLRMCLIRLAQLSKGQTVNPQPKKRK